MRLVRSVREVQAEDVHAGADQAFQRVGCVARRSDCRDNPRVTHAGGLQLTIGSAMRQILAAPLRRLSCGPASPGRSADRRNPCRGHRCRAAAGRAGDRTTAAQPRSRPEGARRARNRHGHRLLRNMDGAGARARQQVDLARARRRRGRPRRAEISIAPSSPILRASSLATHLDSCTRWRDPST